MSIWNFLSLPAYRAVLVRAIWSGKLQYFCLAQCNLWKCFISVPVYKCAGILKPSSPCPKCIFNGSFFPTSNSRALFVCFQRVKRDSVRQLFSLLKHSSCRPSSLQLVGATVSISNPWLNPKQSIRWQLLFSKPDQMRKCKAHSWGRKATTEASRGVVNFKL